MFKGSEKFITINPAYFKTYFTSDFLLFMMVMILVFAGAGLISDDLKHNALQLYFSRPLGKKDYLLGKASVVFFFILLLTLVPGLLFIVFKLIFSGSFRFLAEYPWLILSVIGYSALLTLFFACYTLLLSALSKNRRYVTILIFAVYLFSDILYGILFGIFRSPYVALFSLKGNLQQAGAMMFGQKPPFAFPAYLSFLVLAAICAVAAAVLWRRICGASRWSGESPTIETRNLSKWYGNVLGLSDVTLSIEPGITGLLGPNGAGKSTFMKLLTGQLKPNIGDVAVLGRRIRNAYPLFAKIGFCPESDAFYEEITGWEFLTGAPVLLRLFAGRGPGPGDEGPGHRRAHRGQGPEDPRLQPGHAPAHQVRPGHRP